MMNSLSYSLSHWQTFSSLERRRFYLLQAVRTVIAVLAAVFLHKIGALGVNVFLLTATTAVGTLLSGAILKRKPFFLPVIAIHTIIFGLVWFGFLITNYFILSTPELEPKYDFLVSRIADQTLILAIFYSVSFLCSWFFWTRNHFVTLEGTTASVLLVWLLSGHRNYHIDAPKQLSSLTWNTPLLQWLHITPQQLLIALTALYLTTLILYLAFSSSRPLFLKQLEKKSFAKTSRLLSLVFIFLALFLLVYYSAWLNKTYSSDLSQLANGVGMTPNTEGQRKLSFKKSVQPTQQPAAIVRLEGDYNTNPWSPMLYFREGAVSSFDGLMLVNAPPNYDSDVPRIPVGIPYQGTNTTTISNTKTGKLRQSVIQSIYILVKHEAPFAIDFPEKISILKNPDPHRFILAYQAASLAPSKPIDTLLAENVGDSSWDQDTWAHYLRAPGSRSLDFQPLPEPFSSKPVLDPNGEDLRYLALAKKITEGLTSPVEKASKIAEYLSEQSIYNGSPNHLVGKNGDPVAPYLFAPEKRGYCVHFSHAAVYLMRLSGIPARIGTGYLVDLTYAKDGHILLQLGDRHAWAEVYIENQGWLVFDVAPARAENEQMLIPDPKLLEELMSKLDPAQVMLEPLPKENNTSLSLSVLPNLISSMHLKAALFLTFCAYLIAKIWLRCAHLFIRSGRNRVRVTYRSFASLMADLQIPRDYGETRIEYAQRLKGNYGINAELLTSLIEKNSYSLTPPSLVKQELNAVLAQTANSYSNTRWRFVKRCLSFFNPASIFRINSW